MKKLILIVILFVSNSLLLTQDISSKYESSERKAAEINAENDFRRKIISKLNDLYESNLNEYYEIFAETNQNLNRQLINDLIKKGKKNTTYVNNTYTTTISMTNDDFNAFLPNTSIPEISNIIELLPHIDKSLLSPNKNTYPALQRLTELLKTLVLEYHEKVLMYKESEVEIEINTPENMTTFLEFNFLGENFIKTSDIQNKIIVKINSSETRTSTSILSFHYITPRTFRTTRLTYNKFFDSFIEKNLPNFAGQISIIQVGESKFIYRTTNFEVGRNEANIILNKKGWGVGNVNNYTHVIRVNKETIEEKQLNIGAYYVKARLVMHIYDKQNQLIQTTHSKTVETLDNNSLENALRKMNDMLIKEMEKLF